MKDILSRGGREILQQFAWSNVLVAFDYDGTLAPIVADPERALMRKTTRTLLQTLTKAYPVVVISGRAQPDALRKLRGAGVFQVIGNHGIEPRHSAERYRTEVRRWLPTLDRCVAPFRGVRIENKIYSVAVHYRQAREKKKGARGGPCGCRRARSRAGDRREAGDQHPSRSGPRTRASHSRASAIDWAATLRSTSATTRRTRTSSNSTNRAAS